MDEVWCVYILELSNGAYYTGITNNIEQRLEKHKTGKGSKYVRSFLPLKLAYIEQCESKSAALKREIYIKKLSRKKKELLVKGQL